MDTSCSPATSASPISGPSCSWTTLASPPSGAPRILHDKDCWVSYPFENALGELPLEHNLECTEGVIRAHLARQRGEPEPRDFQQWIQWKMGAGVAKHFMEPYNRKIWKSDLSEMSTVWIAGRVPDAPLEDVLQASLGATTEGYTHQSVFRYPRQGGFAAVHERIARPVADRIQLNHRVEHIERRPDGGWRVDGEDFDHVVSTIPLHVLPDVLADMDDGRHGGRPGAQVPRRGRLPAGRRGGVRDTLQLGSTCPTQSRARPTASPTSRTTAPRTRPRARRRSWPRSPTRGPRRTSASRAGARWPRVSSARGLLDASRLTITDAAINPVSYILYDLDFEAKRNRILECLDGLGGFHAIGRFGRYEYHNSDQCLARAMDLHASLKPVLAKGGGPLDA